LSGDPVAIAEGIDSFPLATYGLFSVSETGIVVYRGSPGLRLTPTWFDLQGRPGATLGDPGEYVNPAVSPDGARVAVARGPATNRDIWLLDVARGTSTRFTVDAASDDNPVWSPDGRSIVFSSTRLGQSDLYLKPADGSANERLLFKSDESKAPTSWSSDGRSLLFTSIGAKTAEDIWALPMQGESKPLAIVQTPFPEAGGRFSPDSRWIVYRSSESGTSEIHVRPFSLQGGADTIGGPRLISRGNGSYHSRWRSDGKALFYATVGSPQTVMEVDIDTSQGFRAGTPRSLFAAPPSALSNGWDIAPDGKRFLFFATPGDGRTIPFTVVVNWAAALKR
jgi:Tol biopolymer transport system component